MAFATHQSQVIRPSPSLVRVNERSQKTEATKDFIECSFTVIWSSSLVRQYTAQWWKLLNAQLIQKMIVFDDLNTCISNWSLRFGCLIIWLELKLIDPKKNNVHIVIILVKQDYPLIALKRYFCLAIHEINVNLTFGDNRNTGSNWANILGKDRLR